MFIYLFIYYQFLSKTGVTQKAKPVQGASPQKLHTTYTLYYTYTQDQTNKHETYTQIKFKLLRTKKQKMF